MSLFSVPPLKNAKRQVFVLKNFLNNSSYYKGSWVVAGELNWLMYLYKGRNVISCELDPPMFGNDHKAAELEVRAVLVNHVDPTKNYGFSVKYKTTSGPFSRELCLHQLVFDNQEEFLTNGNLKIHFELRVDFLIGQEGFRRINFYDPLPDEDCLEIVFDKKIRKKSLKLYTRKLMPLTHSPVLAVEINAGKSQVKLLPEICSCDADWEMWRKDFEEVLQIIHGVPGTRKSCVHYASTIALKYQMSSVIMHLGRMSVVRRPVDDEDPRDFWSHLPIFMKIFINETGDLGRLRRLCYTTCVDRRSVSLEVKKAVVAKSFSFARCPEY